MPLETPRHSKQINCEVYHNHTDCTEANNIEERYFEWGTGDKRLCKHCESLGNRDGIARKYARSMSNALLGGYSGLGLVSGALSGLAAFKKEG